MDHSTTTSTPDSQATRCVCLHLPVCLRGDVRARRVATTLDQAGYAVHIVDFESEPNQPERLGGNDGIPVRHIIMPNLFVPARFKPWFLVKLVRMIAKGTRQLLAVPADVYHASDLKALPASYIAARLRRKPLIFETYELPMVDPKVVRWRRLHMFSMRLFRALLRGCAAVIVVSPPIAQEMHQQYGIPMPLVLRNLPVYQVAPRETNRLREALHLPSSTRIVLYQGYIHEDRSLDILVRAAKYLLPDTVIVLLGDGSINGQIQALIRHEGVEDRVKMLPAVPYAELLSWTASADLGLNLLSPDFSLSIRYCLPNKLFEYLMAGLPVLTSQLDAVVEVVRQYEVGQVVSSLAPEAVGEAINTLLADPVALARMRTNALAAARNDLNWEVEQRKLIALFRGAIGETLPAAVPPKEAHTIGDESAPAPQHPAEHRSHTLELESTGRIRDTRHVENRT